MMALSQRMNFPLRRKEIYRLDFKKWMPMEIRKSLKRNGRDPLNFLPG